jgi:hypothetical protein
MRRSGEDVPRKRIMGQGERPAAENNSHLLQQRRELHEVDIVVGDRLLHHAEGGRQGGSADRSVWRLTPCGPCP